MFFFRDELDYLNRQLRRFEKELAYTDNSVNNSFTKRDLKYSLRLNLAGFEPNEVTIATDNGRLDVKAEKKEDDPYYGKYSYSATIPKDAAVETADAVLKNGILTVYFDVRTVEKPSNKIVVRTE